MKHRNEKSKTNPNPKGKSKTLWGRERGIESARRAGVHFQGYAFVRFANHLTSQS